MKRKNFREIFYGSVIFLISLFVFLHGFNAWLRVSIPNILPIDCVGDFLIKNEITQDKLLFYKVREFRYPGVDWQWRVLNNFQVDYSEKLEDCFDEKYQSIITNEMNKFEIIKNSTQQWKENLITKDVYGFYPKENYYLLQKL